MGVIKRALRRTSRKLLGKIIPPAHSHQLVLNPQCTGELAPHQAEQLAGKRKLASIQKRFKKSGSSKDTAVAEAMLLAVKNHLPPLQFHHIHGPHAQLDSNRCVARRSQSFCQALVFSNRVILPNERVYIKVLEIAKCWSGTIRFGFTAVDPATLACRMPKHACPDMTNAGHTWARALADEVVRRNSVIHFSYNKNGVIHYGINNQDCGIFHANVRTSQNLWFIVDIYGLTAAVELIDPRVNNGPNNGINFSPQELEGRPTAGGRHHSTMYKSTSAMEELFGGRYGSSSLSSRRKKLLRKHARHAAMIQAANWPLDNYAGAYGEHAQHVNQLPNLNSVTLPSAQQNIYSPMPNATAAAEQQHQHQQQPTRRRNETHDYHQIVSNTHSHAAYQPLRVATGASTLNGSISLANIAHGAASSSSGVATSNGPNEAASISQADLSHQLENMRLYERRMRRHAASATASKSANQAPVAATRTRQHLQQINTNHGNHKRTSETTGRDQADKLASSHATQRIVSTKSASSSSASASSAATSTNKASSSSHANVKPKTRHSIKSQKATAASGAAVNNDNNPPGKDCPICFERPINCVLYQCGHMCTCYECGVKQWKTQSRTCPICRTVIKDVIKTYMS